MIQSAIHVSLEGSAPLSEDKGTSLSKVDRMKRETMRTKLGPLIAFGAATLASVFVNGFSIQTWGFGARGFEMLMLLGCLVAWAKVYGRRISVPALEKPKMLVVVLCVLSGLLVGWMLLNQISKLEQFSGYPLESDISTNTLMAGDAAFQSHTNPYESPAQTGHRVEDAPHVTVENGQVKMFGVPYYYGYPYFPGMFLSFEPFRFMDSSQQAIRTGNAIYYFALLGAMAWLAASMVPKGYRTLAALLALLSFVCTRVLARELFFYCTTDIVIPLFALLGFIALRYGKVSISGALFGWAMACKLVPGGLFFLVLVVWFWRRPDRWKFLGPLIVVFFATMLPYVLSNPSAFISATVLYYLTEHARGDSTALWYTLPKSIQSLFQIVGYAAVVGIACYWASRKGFGILGALAICFISGAVFVAFSRMAHLNYVWAIMPLGSVALAVSLLGGQNFLLERAATATYTVRT